MPNKINYISEDTVNLLTQAAAEAEAAIANGKEPSKAFLDVAKKYGLNSEQVKLLVRGWNITNFTDKLKGSKKLEDRLGNIPVVHFDELEKSLKTPEVVPEIKQADIWSGYSAPPEARIKRLNQKDPLDVYVYRDKENSIFHKIAAADKQLSRRFNEIADLRRQAKAALQTTIADFQIKFARLKKLLETFTIPDEIFLGNLSSINKLAAKIASDALQRVKRANLVNNNIDYSFDSKKEPYNTALACAQLMKNIDEYATAVDKLEKIYESFGFDDAVIKKKAQFAVETMEISPLVGGVYSGLRTGYFKHYTLDVEDPDFFVFKKGEYIEEDDDEKKAEEIEEIAANDQKSSRTYEDPLSAILGSSEHPFTFVSKDIDGLSPLHAMWFKWRKRRDNSGEGQPDSKNWWSIFTRLFRHGNKSNESSAGQEQQTGERQNTERQQNGEGRSGSNNRQDGEGPADNNNERGGREPRDNRRRENNPVIIVNIGKNKESEEEDAQKKSKKRFRFLKSDPDAGKKFGESIFKELTDIAEFLEKRYTPDPGSSVEEIRTVENYNDLVKSIDFIRSLSMATELMATDPVIGDYDLKEVVIAVHTIYNLSPGLAGNKYVLTMLVRKYLEQGGQLDINDILALTKLQPPEGTKS